MKNHRLKKTLLSDLFFQPSLLIIIKLLCCLFLLLSLSLLMSTLSTIPSHLFLTIRHFQVLFDILGPALSNGSFFLMKVDIIYNYCTVGVFRRFCGHLVIHFNCFLKKAQWALVEKCKARKMQFFDVFLAIDGLY